MSGNITYTSPHDAPVLIGVIGGSGMYNFQAMQDVKHYSMMTPYGAPSGDVRVANVGGVWCAFIPRHGYQHTLTPDEVNYRANIFALKVLGVKYLIAVNAVGSLDERYKPGDIVLADQFIDRTTGRRSTFFENGIVAHVCYGYPASETFRNLAHKSISKAIPQINAKLSNQFADWKLHSGATMVTMSGPQFSTRAESILNKSLNGHLIGMTTATEAKLAREAEMAYLVIAAVTDMDSWSDAPHVDAESVIKVMRANQEKVQMSLVEVLVDLGANMFEDPAHNALEFAISTKEEAITKEVKQRLAPLLAKYPRFAV
ncbi:putative Phosphorylase superfamily [Trypanosoma vivax]|uniref:S-methyl-5'-thioadenosine phosphorylase n=1 Tax=Trypanosoma vivax (strain Y486) TaxID=1055687 RepID=G0TZF8_TRYVY|nr:putative methylthioadenosine phosphorylase [Trypanosoma vivax]KAH8616971.1 putative Phosphorylase superfamily [Trypanosoma vivax]CCC49361.1 putative methylthioadenosine phosphorylase [Trypanosoma vivax Y486]